MRQSYGGNCLLLLRQANQKLQNSNNYKFVYFNTTQNEISLNYLNIEISSKN